VIVACRRKAGDRATRPSVMVGIVCSVFFSASPVSPARSVVAKPRRTRRVSTKAPAPSASSTSRTRPVASVRAPVRYATSRHSAVIRRSLAWATRHSATASRASRALGFTATAGLTRSASASARISPVCRMPVCLALSVRQRPPRHPPQRPQRPHRAPTPHSVPISTTVSPRATLVRSVRATRIFFVATKTRSATPASTAR
jgi:hypothetical protein